MYNYEYLCVLSHRTRARLSPSEERNLFKKSCVFTPYKKKGEMYMHYPHVGKHFLELFLDNDVDVLPEQIMITNKVANTFSFWCGEDMYAEGEREKIFYERLKSFYDKISDKLPYQWGDPRLAIGYVPIGKFTGKIVDFIPEIGRN